MAKKKILLVDDNPDITRPLSLLLEASGNYEVRAENLGQNALTTARIFRPDLIFLDIMMPDMDGNEIAAILEKDEDLKHIKIVFLTAIVTKGEVAAGSITEISGHPVLAKPVRSREMIDCIEELLRD
ncbi:MAG: response regulator [Deltaproteobacteria bacterium]|nr:MAG: response regulator [Deltaproteobacteria bacterium]